MPQSGPLEGATGFRKNCSISKGLSPQMVGGEIDVLSWFAFATADPLR